MADYKKKFKIIKFIGNTIIEVEDEDRKKEEYIVEKPIDKKYIGQYVLYDGKDWYPYQQQSNQQQRSNQQQQSNQQERSNQHQQSNQQSNQQKSNNNIINGYYKSVNEKKLSNRSLGNDSIKKYKVKIFTQQKKTNQGTVKPKLKSEEVYGQKCEKKINATSKCNKVATVVTDVNGKKITALKTVKGKSPTEKTINKYRVQKII